MRIGGFHPFSLTDFPGRVAAVVFTQGCNFRCPYCHNGQLIPMQGRAGHELSLEEILTSIETRSDRLGGLVITGGEPTLQPDLARVFRWARSLGLDTKLDTNGSRPDVLYELLGGGLLSYVAMDIKAPFDKYEQMTGVRPRIDEVRRSIDLIAGSGVEHEFRTTIDDVILSLGDIDEIRNLVPAGSPYRLQEVRRQSELS